MVKKKWPTQINGNKFWIIESIDSIGNRIWIKFEPINNLQPMEVANILDQPSKVAWRFRNSHFETVDQNGLTSNYYQASEAGSIQVSQGTTVFSKDIGRKIVLFPLETGVTMNVQGNTVVGERFTMSVNKSTWMGFVTDGGSINPT
jgi:hypothetical protein